MAHDRYKDPEKRRKYLREWKRAKNRKKRYKCVVPGCTRTFTRAGRAGRRIYCGRCSIEQRLRYDNREPVFRHWWDRTRAGKNWWVQDRVVLRERPVLSGGTGEALARNTMFWRHNNPL